jgi:hypothetical protein
VPIPFLIYELEDELPLRQEIGSKDASQAKG